PVTDAEPCDVLAACGLNHVGNGRYYRCPQVELPQRIEAIKYEYIAVEIQNPRSLAKDLGKQQPRPHDAPEATDDREASQKVVAYAVQVDLRPIRQTHLFQQPDLLV